MPWRRLAALVTLTNAQLVVDWTAKSTFDHEKGKPLTARCPLYSTVALHRTCLSNADPRKYLQYSENRVRGEGTRKFREAARLRVIEGRPGPVIIL